MGIYSELNPLKKVIAPRKNKFFLLSIALLTATLIFLINNITPEKATAFQNCNSVYEIAQNTVDKSEIRKGLKFRLNYRVNTAYKRYGLGFQDSSVQQLSLALTALSTPINKQTIPTDALQQLNSDIGGFRACVSNVPPVPTAKLTVRTFFPSSETPDSKVSAGSGVIIKVNGEELGQTQRDGTATLRVPAGDLQLAALLYPSSGITAETSIQPKEKKQIDLILDEGKEISEDTQLNSTEVIDGVLSQNFTTFSLEFLNGEEAVSLSELETVELLDPLGDQSVDLTNLFALQNGTVTATDVNALRQIFLSRSGAIDISARGYDASGRTHENDLRLYIGRYRVAGILKPSPTSTSLNTAGIPITAKILNTDLVFNVVSNSAGGFEIDNLPTGNLEFSSETLQNSQYYYGQGVTTLESNLGLNIYMLSVNDLVNGSTEFEVTQLGNSLNTLNNLKTSNLIRSPRVSKFSSQRVSEKILGV